MRALVIYDPTKRVSQLAEGIAEGLREGALTVELLAASERPDGVIPVASYSLICAGSATTGPFSGKLNAPVEATLNRCSRMEGKPAGAFVVPGIVGAGKALKRLMGAMERQGAMVQDFADVRTREDALQFGRRLQALVRGK